MFNQIVISMLLAAIQPAISVDPFHNYYYANRWTPYTYPDPINFERCGRNYTEIRVCDPDNIITEEGARRIELELYGECESCCPLHIDEYDYYVGIAIMDTMRAAIWSGELLTLEAFANGLYKRTWLHGIGQCSVVYIRRTIIVVYVHHSREMFIKSDPWGSMSLNNSQTMLEYNKRYFSRKNVTVEEIENGLVELVQRFKREIAEKHRHREANKFVPHDDDEFNSMYIIRWIGISTLVIISVAICCLLRFCCLKFNIWHASGPVQNGALPRGSGFVFSGGRTYSSRTRGKAQIDSVVPRRQPQRQAPPPPQISTVSNGYVMKETQLHNAPPEHRDQAVQCKFSPNLQMPTVNTPDKKPEPIKIDERAFTAEPKRQYRYDTVTHRYTKVKTDHSRQTATSDVPLAHIGGSEDETSGRGSCVGTSILEASIDSAAGVFTAKSDDPTYYSVTKAPSLEEIRSPLSSEQTAHIRKALEIDNHKPVLVNGPVDFAHHVCIENDDEIAEQFVARRSRSFDCTDNVWL